ncbi:MAG: XRE family transcriptional regulator [Candidatus Saccharicenans sp.]|nr:XRE family transcriptional regulator [Candidatus Saccharicenans sp.]
MGGTSDRPGLDPTFPLRLRAARLKAGLSLEDLAQKLGGIITRQAIAKYEKGLISPSPEVLEHLLQVLEIPPSPDIPEEVPEKPEEFTAEIRACTVGGASVSKKESMESKQGKPGIITCRYISNVIPPTPTRRAQYLQRAWAELIPEEEIEMRPEPRLARKQVLALRIILSEKMKNYLWLEKLLRQEKLFQPPFKLKILKMDEAEKAAEDLRRHWDLGTGTVTNLLTFLEERGIKTFRLAGPEKFESHSGFYRGQPFIAVEDNLPVDRVRFRAAAELAQVLFGLANDPETIRLYNRFAAAFLLPARILEEYFLPAGRKIAFSELAEIKTRYGISLQAIMRRALDLELVTERRFRSFREMMNEKGWLWKEPVEYRGEENPSRFRRLLHYAVSSEILTPERAAALAETTPEELKKEMGEIF